MNENNNLYNEIQLTEKEKSILRRVFKAANAILDDIKNNDDGMIMLDFDQNDLFNLAEKLDIDY